MTSLSGFGSCCGLNMAVGFLAGDDKAHEWLRKYRTTFVPGRSWFELDDKTKAANNCVIVLNGKQKKEFQKALDEGGWVVAHKFVNHNYNDVLYLMVCDTQPERSPSNPKFDASKYEEVRLKHNSYPKLDYVLPKESTQYYPTVKGDRNV